MAEKLLFVAENHHDVDQCEPPVIDWSKVHYRSYFENEHGDQWMCWLDDSGVHFAGGDAGWGTVATFPVTDIVERSPFDLGVQLPFVLSLGEYNWFCACQYAVATRQRLRAAGS